MAKVTKIVPNSCVLQPVEPFTNMRSVYGLPPHVDGTWGTGFGGDRVADVGLAYDSSRVDQKDGTRSKTFSFKAFREILTSRPKRNADVRPTASPLTVDVTAAETFLDDARNKLSPYPMRSTRRGVLLLINNVTFRHQNARNGADVDETNLVRLFEQLGFNIRRHRDLTLNNMKDVIAKFTKSESLSKYDCCFIVVSSYGASSGSRSLQETRILTSDGKKIDAGWLIESFDDAGCEALIGKPKVILFNLSRGDNADTYTLPESNSEKTTVSIDCGYKINNLTDTLIGYSTVPGYSSFRNMSTGSWYIHTLCDVFMRNAHDTDVENMLRLVSMEVNGIKAPGGDVQTPVIESHCFRPCYLHPKLYIEDGRLVTEPSCWDDAEDDWPSQTDNVDGFP